MERLGPLLKDTTSHHPTTPWLPLQACYLLLGSTVSVRKGRRASREDLSGWQDRLASVITWAAMSGAGFET